MDSQVFSELATPDLPTTDDVKSAIKFTSSPDVEASNRASRLRKLNDSERTEQLAEAWRLREIQTKG